MSNRKPLISLLNTYTVPYSYSEDLTRTLWEYYLMSAGMREGDGSLLQEMSVHVRVVVGVEISDIYYVTHQASKISSVLPRNLTD